MTETIIMYIALAVIALFVILSIGIKLEKMVKVIVGNYMLWFLCCMIVICLNMFLSTLGVDNWLYKFLSDTKYVIAYLLYLWLMILIYHRFTIKSKISADPILEKTSYLIFVPINVVWLCIVPLFIYVFPHLVQWLSLTEIADNFTNNLYLQKIIVYLPHIFAVYSILTILSFCEFKWGWWDSPSIT